MAALKQLEGEHQRLLAEQEENTAFFEKAQPDSDELERTLSQVTADLELNKEKVSELEETLSPMRREIVSLSERLSDGSPRNGLVSPSDLPTLIEWYPPASRRYLHLHVKMQVQCSVSMLLG